MRLPLIRLLVILGATFLMVAPASATPNLDGPTSGHRYRPVQAGHGVLAHVVLRDVARTSPKSKVSPSRPLMYAGSADSVATAKTQIAGMRSLATAAPQLLSNLPRLTQPVAAFTAISGSNCTCEPPDGAIAASTMQEMFAANTVIGVRNKITGAVIAMPIAPFVAPLFSGTPYIPTFSDPRLLYDQVNGRFIFVVDAIDDFYNVGWLILAVSDTADATGTWTLYGLNVGYDGPTFTGYWGDYPTLGQDSQAIYVTMNMYNFGSYPSFRESKVMALNKVYVYGGTLFTYGWVEWNGLLDPSTGHLAFTIQPAAVYGASPGVEYLVDAAPSSTTGGSTLTLWTLTNPTNPTLALMTSTTLTVPVYYLPVNAAQPGTTWLLDTDDMRLLSATYLNGRLYVTSNTTIPQATGNYAGVRFYEIAPASATVLKAQDIGFIGAHAFYGSVTADLATTAHVFLGMDCSSANLYPSICAASWQESDQISTYTSGLLFPGLSSYLGKRWGDYHQTVPDPDGETVWTLGEWASDLFTWQTEGLALTWRAPTPFRIYLPAVMNGP